MLLHTGLTIVQSSLSHIFVNLKVYYLEVRTLHTAQIFELWKVIMAATILSFIATARQNLSLVQILA